MGTMGRPQEFEPDDVTYFRLYKFPKSLGERFKKMAKDRGEKQIDMIRGIIAKELDAKFLTKPPLEIQDDEKFVSRTFFNISAVDWAKFQCRALHYDKPATELFLELMQLEILRHEKRTDVIAKYQKKFDPEPTGTLSFTLKLPQKYSDAILLFGKDFSLTVNAIVHDAIQQVNNPEYQELVEFDKDKLKKVYERRLHEIDRALWTEFRKFCIMKNLNTNRILISFVRHYMLSTYQSNVKGDFPNKNKAMKMLS